MSKICSKCGAQVKKGEKFCDRCGASQEILEVKASYTDENISEKGNVRKISSIILKNKKKAGIVLGTVIVGVIMIFIISAVIVKNSDVNVLKFKIYNTVTANNATVKIKLNDEIYSCQYVFKDDQLYAYGKNENGEVTYIDNVTYRFHEDKYYILDKGYFSSQNIFFRNYMQYYEMIKKIKQNKDEIHLAVSSYDTAASIYSGYIKINVKREVALNLMLNIITGNADKITTSLEDFSKKNGTYVGTINVKQLVKDLKNEGYISLGEEMNLSDIPNVQISYTIETGKKYITCMEFELGVPGEDKQIFKLEFEDIGTIKLEDCNAIDLKNRCEKYAK